jgi:hypothetical protein
VSAPLLPGVPAPATRADDVMHTLTTPVVAGAAAMSPLIHPLTEAQPIARTSWSTPPGLTTPGLLAAPVITPSPSSSPSPSSRTAH